MSLEDAVIAWEQAVATQNTILVELSHRCQTIEAKLEHNSQALEDARLTTLSGQFHALYDALCKKLDTLGVKLEHYNQVLDANDERLNQLAKKLDGMKNSLEASEMRLSTIADGRDYLNSRYSDSHGKLEALEGLCNKLFVKLNTLEDMVGDIVASILLPKRKARK